MPFWKRKKPEPEQIEEAVKEAVIENFSMLDLPDISADRADAYIKKIESTYRKRAPKPEGVAMDSACTPNYTPDYSMVNLQALGFLAGQGAFIGYGNMELLAQHWIMVRACGLRVNDATKKWYEISVGDGTELSAEQIKVIEKLDKQYKLKENMREGVFFRNVFGVRHILFKHADENFDYSAPFNPDSWGEGDYAGMSQIDPSWIQPGFENDDLSDPTRIGFYEPTYWIIGGKKYHKSHFVVLRGAPVADRLKPTYRYGGVSTVQMAYERAYAAERSANEGPQLLMTKRLVNRFVDLVKAQADKVKFNQSLVNMSAYRDNYGVNVLGKDENVSQLDTTLSDVDSVITKQYEVVCAIFGDPVSKIMGTGHGGLGTGETDEDYYISNVEQLQGDELEAIGQAHYARLIPAEIKPRFDVEPEIEMSWRPLKVMSAKEIAEINNINANTDAILESLGSIDRIDIAKRLIADKISGYSGIEEPIIEDDEEPDFDGDDQEGEGVDNGAEEG